MCLEDKDGETKVENKPATHKQNAICERNVGDGRNGENNTDAKT
jgi:hypothetical protein